MPWRSGTGLCVQSLVDAEHFQSVQKPDGIAYSSVTENRTLMCV
jgi:hypothetical protein